MTESPRAVDRRTWCNDIHADILQCVLLRHCAREAEDGVFGRALRQMDHSADHDGVGTSSLDARKHCCLTVLPNCPYSQYYLKSGSPIKTSAGARRNQRSLHDRVPSIWTFGGVARRKDRFYELLAEGKGALGVDVHGGVVELDR